MEELAAEPALLALAALVLVVAYFVRGVAGFGSGLIAIPLLTLMYPLSVTVPLVVALDYLGSLAQGLRQWRSVSWWDVLPLVPFTMVGVGIALFFFHAIDETMLKRVLGGFVLLFAVYQLLPAPNLRGSRWSAFPYGLLGGLVGTLFGTGGPLYVIYFKLRELDKLAFRASFAIYFVIDGSVRLSGYAAFGVLTAQVAYALLIAVPIAALGLYLGGRAHIRLSEIAFKRIISGLLVCSGLALLFGT